MSSDRSPQSVFFARVRRDLFDGRLAQSQVAGMQAILAAARVRALAAPVLAYILATAFHETGRRMVPVREGFARDDAGAMAAVASLHRRGVISVNYALIDPETGQSYYGRGPVQITWRRNYERLGALLNLPLVTQPDLALDPKTGIDIMFEGMLRGLFGRRLSDFIGDAGVDFIGARRSVNGTDKAALIAGYADRFLSAVRDAVEVQEALSQVPTGGSADPPAPAPVDRMADRVAALEAHVASNDARWRRLSQVVAAA